MRRLICVTGIGAGDSRGHGGFLYDRVIAPFLLKTIYQDKDRQEALIRASGTDWTMVRPGFLTNGPLTGKYRLLTDLTGAPPAKSPGLMWPISCWQNWRPTATWARLLS